MIEQAQLLGELALAALLAGLIGYEREAADKPAGIRTHIVLGVAACLVVGVGELVYEASGASSAGGDPNRALHAVITGVGFIGAGTILRDRADASISGLTTAGSLFVVSAIGAAVALGYWFTAAGATLLILLTLHAVGWATNRLEERRDS